VHRLCLEALEQQIKVLLVEVETLLAGVEIADTQQVVVVEQVPLEQTVLVEAHL
jgi:hypothetical protein